MSKTTLEHIHDNLGLTFPLPNDKGQRTDFNDRSWQLLVLFGLQAIGAGIATAGGASTPASSSVNVTDTGAVIASANAEGQIVEVINNGDKTVLIRQDGSDPAFADGGTILINRGIALDPGDYWVSPKPITTAVKAVTASGEQTGVDVTVYP